MANDFGTEVIYPMIKEPGIETQHALRTYTEHIIIQIKNAITILNKQQPVNSNYKLLATGGGSLNTFLIQELTERLKQLNVDVIVPDKKLVNFKEALIMAFIGVLRWRQQFNVLSSVTGAERNNIGGALWTGQEA